MASYEDMSLEELREECKKRDLKVSGNKDELVGRLELNDIESESGDDASTDVEDEVDAADAPEAEEGDSDEAGDEDGDDEGEPDTSDDPEEGRQDAAPSEDEPTSRPARVATRGSGEAEAVAKVKGRLPQEDPDKSPFKYAVLPDGRKAPLK